MNPVYLHKDEADWELTIRGICTKNLANREVKVSILRGHLTCEKEKNIIYPEVPMNFKDEVEICKTKISLMSNLVNSFFSDNRHPDYIRLKTRLLHLSSRINYLKPFDNSSADMKAQLISQNMILIDKLEERTMVKIPILNQVNSTVKEINLIDIENNDIEAQSQNVPFSAQEYVNSFPETSFSQDNQRCVTIISNVLLNSQTPNQVYSHFSSHAKRVKELKEIFEFVDLEYKSVLENVPTRWLSLYPAVERLIRVFPALESYFISLGEELSVALKQYFQNKSEGNKTTITECYLSFFHNSYLENILRSCTKLETKTILCFEVLRILEDLRSKLEQRLLDAIFSLEKTYTSDDLTETVTSIGLDSSLDMDKLYEEYCEISKATSEAAACRDKSPVDK
ncbi:unnamed protein product [Ceutorhynchus assimilis]|uniref:Uncharacterized protein n=1 Tax=Ceutorhynchus assimilis TaxID=467358 RepID=A0A9N9MF83_9CUCU|nr:unnamed protein product [Ceutorhynchus assimilis]